MIPKRHTNEPLISTLYHYSSVSLPAATWCLYLSTWLGRVFKGRMNAQQNLGTKFQNDLCLDKIVVQRTFDTISQLSHWGIENPGLAFVVDRLGLPYSDDEATGLPLCPRCSVRATLAYPISNLLTSRPLEPWFPTIYLHCGGWSYINYKSQWAMTGKSNVLDIFIWKSSKFTLVNGCLPKEMKKQWRTRYSQVRKVQR